MRVDAGEVIALLELEPSSASGLAMLGDADVGLDVADPSSLGLVRYAPNAVTLLGHGLTIWWLAGGPLLAGAVGLLCDDVDGWLARKLGATSRFGGTYDWATDITLCSVILDKLGVLPLALALVPIQAYRKEFGPPVAPLSSARAALTAVLAVVRATK